ncbi:MAG: translocation/assembly module TamB domain-containing protein [Bacteroidales bacterium]|nr:translocation/assembly module TamB domain-containing protein [Candidatus Colimorpha pelethequi]
MKKGLKITGKILCGTLLGLYILIALCNFSFVQSYLGALAGRYVSNKSGGTVEIGSLHINPLGHVVLRNVLLVNPEGDSITNAGYIGCWFTEFPFKDNHLKFSKVQIKNTYYHLGFSDICGQINLYYIIDAFRTESKESTKPKAPFVVDAKELILSDVHYKQDLKGHSYDRYANGVNIQHMDFEHIKAKIKNIKVVEGDVDCRFVRFQADECSGWHLKDLSGDVQVNKQNIRFDNMELTTDSTHMLCDVMLKYNGWEEMQDYCNKVKHSLIMKPGTVLSMSDAGYWAPTLWGMDERIEMEGVFYGTISDLHADEVEIAFGNETHLHLNGHIVGLPHIDRTTIKAKITGMHTTYDDLAAVKHPDRYDVQVLPLIKTLGTLDINAQMDGGFHDCTAAVDVNSNVGNITGDFWMKRPDKQIEFGGVMASANFGLAKLLPNEYVDRGGFEIDINGKGTSLQDADVKASGKLHNIAIATLKGDNKEFNTIDAVELDATLRNEIVEAAVKVQDSLVGLNLKGNIDLKNGYAGSLDMALDNCHLDQLIEGGKSPHNSVVSTRMRTDFNIKKLDVEHKNTGLRDMEVNGFLALSNTRFKLDDKTGSLMNLSMNVKENARRKHLTLNSDVLDCSMDGYFDYEDLPLIVNHFVAQYLPEYYNRQERTTAEEYENICDESFNFTVSLRNSENLLRTFAPEIAIANGTTIEGSYNFTESMRLLVRSDSMQFNGIHLQGLDMNAATLGDKYRINLESDNIATNGAPLFENLQAILFCGRDDSFLNIEWNGEQHDNQGIFHLHMASDTSGNRITLAQSNFQMGKSSWDITCPEGIFFADGELSVADFLAEGDEQTLLLNATLEADKEGWARIDFDNFSFDSISQLFLHGNNLKLHGWLNGTGEAHLESHDSKIAFHGADLDLHIDSCALNQQPLGKIDLTGTWDQAEGKLTALVASRLEQAGKVLHPIAAKGSLEQGEVTADVTIDDFELVALEPLVSSFSSHFEGRLGGKLNIKGKTSKPVITGKAQLKDCQLLVDRTGVEYAINDSIAFDGKKLTFNNFKILDPEKNRLTLNGAINYADLKALKFNLDAHSDNIMLLGAKERADDFYGKLYASLDGKITGDIDNIQIAASARTNAGSEVVVPMNQNKQIASQSFIHFESPEDIQTIDLSEATTNGKERQTRQDNNQNSHLQFGLDVTVTPDVKLRMPMDFTQVGINLTASGNGDLQITGGKDLTVVGNYELENGSIKLNLLSLVTRNFTIDPGSEIVFPGSLSNVRFNINAAYSQRISTSSLTGYTSNETAQQRVMVENVIMLSGTLQNPTVKFDIRLPNADQTLSEDIFSYIDRSNEQEMMNQTISLLLMGQFYNGNVTENFDNGNLGETALASGYNIAANTLANTVSNIVHFVDFNFGYKAATGLTREQYDVDIRKEWNKFYFETSLGYGGESRELVEGEATSNLVGDVLLGYKINPKLHLFAFNRSNTNDYTRVDLPYIQGVGLKLTHEFNNWKDLFKKKPAEKTQP